MTKQELWTIIQSLPSEFSSKYEDHGWRQELIVIYYDHGQFFAQPEGDKIRIRCVCLGRSIDSLVEPCEVIQFIQEKAKTHQCEPWPG